MSENTFTQEQVDEMIREKKELERKHREVWMKQELIMLILPQKRSIIKCIAECQK